MKDKYCLGLFAALVGLIGLGGCASAPDVLRTYYFPITQQDIAVVQTIGCQIKDKEITGPYSTAIATVATTYVADYSTAERYTFSYKNLDSFFGDSDIAVGLTDDGRLSSINAAGVGEGAAIVKSAATVASNATHKDLDEANIAQIDQDNKEPRLSPLEACTVIRRYGTANEKAGSIFTLTVSYKLRVQYKFPDAEADPAIGEIIVFDDNGKPTDAKSNWNAGIPIPLNTGSTAVTAKDLKGFTKPFILIVSRDDPKGSELQPKMWTEPNGVCASRQDEIGFICVPAIARLEIQIKGPPADLDPNTSPYFYDDHVLAPTSSPHPIPVPKAPAFGKLATTVQIGPSGIVEKLEYNKAAALSDLLNSGAQIYNQTQPQSSTAQAAAVQGQADLIYQQQRLAACQLDHATCQQK